MMKMQHVEQLRAFDMKHENFSLMKPIDAGKVAYLVLYKWE